jgi:hypothetical protein
MITDDQLALLADIFGNTERPDKISLRLDPGSRSITVVYEDLDDEWFREMTQASPTATTPRSDALIKALDALHRIGAALKARELLAGSTMRDALTDEQIAELALGTWEEIVVSNAATTQRIVEVPG